MYEAEKTKESEMDWRLDGIVRLLLSHAGNPTHMLFPTLMSLTYLDAGSIDKDPTEHKQPEARPKAASALLKLVGLSCSIRSEYAPGASRYSDFEPIRFPVMLVADTETCSRIKAKFVQNFKRSCSSVGELMFVSEHKCNGIP